MNQKIILAIFKNKMISSMEDRAASEVLAQELERIQILKSKIVACRSRQEQAKLEFTKKVKEQDDEIGRIQKQCSHEDTQYYPDAAGGNDSWTECLICGASI